MLRDFLFIVIIIFPFINAYPETDEDFIKAENTFKFQDYKKSSELLENLLYPEIKIQLPDNIIKAREYLGACYYWLGDKKRMEEEFTAILIKNPDYELDPFYYPAPLIEEFNNLKKKLISLHIIALKEEKQESEKVEIPKKPLIIKERITKRSYTLNFVPFGFGQFQNSEKGKGWFFLISESLLLGVNIGSYLTVEGLRGDNGFYTHENAEKAKVLRVVQYASLGAFLAVTAWGIVDALRNFKSESVEREIPQELLEPK